MTSRAGDLRRIDDPVALTRAAAAGDERACRRLAERLLDRVAITVRYLSPGDPDADDFTQMAMVEILGSAGSFRAESSLEAWAERIAIRTAMRQLKKRRFRARIVTFDSEREGDAREGLPERMATRHRVSRRVSELLDDLTPERRLVLTLRLVLGYGIEEISEMTGMKINTVRDRLAVARRQLRKKISRDPVLREFRSELGGER